MIIVNEKEFAERCINEEHIIGNPYYTLTIMARYYYFCKGYRNRRIVSVLTDFMEDNYMPYRDNMMDWDAVIEKIAANAGKYPLTVIEEIWITESELSTISAVDNPELERVAFTYLCLAKIAIAKNPNNTGWVDTGDKELFKLARVSCKEIMRDRMIGMLMTKGLLEFSKRNDNLSCRVTFIDETSEKVLRITDFRELGYEYLLYKGGRFIRCQECGILVRNNPNGTVKHCKDCASDSSRYYDKMETKVIMCEDCGKEIIISAKNNKTTRCEDCQKNRKRKKNAEWMREYRNN